MRLRRAVGVAGLVFLGAFAVILGILLLGDPAGLAPGGRVALVEVEGLIVDGDRVVRELIGHGDDPSIRAVIVRIQSPGGVVGPTQEIHDAVREVRERGKPVVASMGSVAASGGYYLAAAADRIVANPGTLTGSIGVLMQLPEVEGLLKKVGVRYEVLKAGRLKDAGNISRPMSAEERAVLQGLLDDMHEQFIAAVAAGRRMDPDRVRRLADGRAFTGRQAHALGLVDTLGGLEAAVRAAGELAHLEGRPRLIRPRKPSGWWSVLDLLGSRLPLGPVGALLPAGPGLPGAPFLGGAKLPLYLMD